MLTVSDALPLTHPTVEYVRDSLTLLFLGQPDRTRRYLAVYGAFWDASGVNKDDPWLALAGFVSTADAWVDFTRDWVAVLERERVRQFHAKDFHARKGEFKDWSDERCVAFSTALVDLINHHAFASVGIAVPAPALREAIPERIAKRVAHPYAIAARTCLVEVAGLLRHSQHIEGPITINHMFAEGDEGWSQFEAAWHYEFHNPKRRELLGLGNLSRGGTVENPPLQAGDMLAWELRRWMATRFGTENQQVRTNLSRLSEIPRRWFHFDEAAVNQQVLINVSLDLNLPPNIRPVQPPRRRSRRDR